MGPLNFWTPAVCLLISIAGSETDRKFHDLKLLQTAHMDGVIHSYFCQHDNGRQLMRFCLPSAGSALVLSLSRRKLKRSNTDTPLPCSQGASSQCDMTEGIRLAPGGLIDLSPAPDHCCLLPVARLDRWGPQPHHPILVAQSLFLPEPFVFPFRER